MAQLLRALPGYGRAKADAVMDQAEISPSRRISGLGKRQHEALLKALQ
ncbi:hypothetical protein [Actinomycetospora soli]|nr:hypothetical protein [Actinomycetospora soli]